MMTLRLIRLYHEAMTKALNFTTNQQRARAFASGALEGYLKRTHDIRYAALPEDQERAFNSGAEWGRTEYLIDRDKDACDTCGTERKLSDQELDPVQLFRGSVGWYGQTCGACLKELIAP